MKKTLCVILVVLFTVCMLGVPAFADSTTIALSQANVTVGTNVTVTLKYNATYEMYAIDGTLTYNNAVLQYVSGGSNNTGSAVKIVEGLSGEKSVTYKIVFKTVAAGSGSLSFSAAASGKGNGNAAAGAAVTVTEVKPSSNANLGSLKLSNGTLTPAFKAGTVNYTASVKYSVDKITISANAAAGDSRVTGAGTFDLKVGENTYSVTVTAASGDKKTYTVKIKRMTEAETAAAEKEERDNNPLLFEYNGADRYIVSDLTNMEEFEGFTRSSIEIKGTKIGYLADKAGKYSLFWATDADSANGAFYNRTEDGEYSKVNCLQTENRIFIIEPFAYGINVNDRFVPAKSEVGGESIDCYKFGDEELDDFSVFYCYFNGKSDYYMFDAAQNTVQRAPTFLSAAKETDVRPSGNIIDKFNQLNTQAKILLLLLCIAGLLVFVLIVLLIVKAVNGKKEVVQKEISSDTEKPAKDYEELPETEPLDEKPQEAAPQAEEPENEEAAREPEEIPDDPDGQEDESGETENETPQKPETNLDTSEFIDFGDDF